MKRSANNHTRPKQRPRIQLGPRLIWLRVCIPTASSGIASGRKPVNVSVPRSDIRIRIHVRSRVVASPTGSSSAWHGACVRATGLLIIVFVCGCKRGPCPRRILATCQHCTIASAVWMKEETAYEPWTFILKDPMPPCVGVRL